MYISSEMQPHGKPSQPSQPSCPPTPNPAVLSRCSPVTPLQCTGLLTNNKNKGKHTKRTMTTDRTNKNRTNKKHRQKDNQRSFTSSFKISIQSLTDDCQRDRREWVWEAGVGAGQSVFGVTTMMRHGRKMPNEVLITSSNGKVHHTVGRWGVHRGGSCGHTG